MKGLYIHIPFCIKKCDYCDFISFSGKEMCFEKYIQKLAEEMKEYNGEEINTVFIGGGTPTVLSASLITKLCTDIKRYFNLSDDTEWTIEANPGTLTDEKINSMLEGGINRISVGIQSFNDEELKVIGRIHNAQTAYNTIIKLDKAGFKNISIDLMESLPFQTEASLKNTLKTAMDLPLKHISVYSLIIEDNTPLKVKYDSGVFNLPDEDSDRDLYALTKKYLSGFGFNRYEISNYSKKGYESRHNLKYWNLDEYIGLGVAAHSFVGNKRFSNTDSLEKYLSGDFRSGESEILTANDRMGEYMMLGLRKTAGVSVCDFKTRFNREIYSVYGNTLKKYINTGFMKEENGFFSLTDKGLDVSNSIMCEFLI